MEKQLAFYFDMSACVGCKACQVACKDKNDLPVGLRWRRVLEYGGGDWIKHPTLANLVVPTSVFAYAISTACMHCQSPLCAQICPTAAITKRADGIVLVNQDQCIGCRYCEWACPYGAPQFNERKGVMTKCNFCEDLLAKGENPVCVAACPMRALEFGDLAELQTKYGKDNAFAPWPSADLTRPALVVTPHKHAFPSGKGGGMILDPEEM